MTAGLALLCCLLMMSGCSSMNEAEKKVSAELKAIQSSESVGSEVINLRNSLSDEGRDHFDGFLKKVGDFDFEITGSETDDSKDNGYTLVKVRIKTYDFGREYLAAWTAYLKANGDDLNQDDLTGFYEMLFAGLDALDDKEYIKFHDEYFCWASRIRSAQAYVQLYHLKQRRLKRKNYQVRRVDVESLHQQSFAVRRDCECESNMPRR